MTAGGSVEIGFRIIGGAKGLVDRFFPNFFRGRVSLFLMGAQGTGKTSFVKTLKYMSVEDIRRTGKSTLKETTETDYSFDDKRSLSLICHDFGGDSIYRDRRQQAVIEAAPLAILFFLDQRDTRLEMPRHLRRGNDRIAVKNWEYQFRDHLAQIDDDRMEEHNRHFNDLLQLLQSNPVLRKHTRLVVPIVTKYDIWCDKLLLDDFHDLFANKIQQLGHLGRTVTPFMAASPIEYYGTPEIMNEVFNRAGREYKLLRWTWRNHSGG